MKKVIALLMAGLMALSLTACGPKTCKEPGCDLEAGKDCKGYCEVHYALHELENLFG